MDTPLPGCKSKFPKKAGYLLTLLDMGLEVQGP